MEPVDPSSSTPSPTPAPAGGAPSTSASLPEPSTMSPEAIAAEIVALKQPNSSRRGAKILISA